MESEINLDLLCIVFVKNKWDGNETSSAAVGEFQVDFGLATQGETLEIPLFRNFFLKIPDIER